MARSHNPFAPKEARKLETPWGTFEVAMPNKSRLAQAEAAQKRFETIDGEDVEEAVEALMDMIAAGVLEGDKLREELSKAWDADDVTFAQITDTTSFISAELRGENEDEPGND